MRSNDSELLRVLADQVDLVMWMAEAKTGRIVYASPAYAKVWGRERESLYRSSLPFIETVHQEDRERVAQAWATHREGGLNEKFRIVTPDGSVRWILARTFPVHSRSGRVVRVAGCAQDVTDQERAQEELRVTLALTRERYLISRRIGAARTAEDVLNALMSLTPLAGAHRAAVLIFDQPWEDSPPSRVNVLLDWQDKAVTPETGGPLATYPLAALFSREGAVTVENTREDPRIPERARLPLAESGSRNLLLFPLITSNQWYGMLVFHFRSSSRLGAVEVDFVEKVVNQAAASIFNQQLLEAEKTARQEAERANELKLKFLAMISHELRTPLTSIKGFATTLLADDVTWDAASQRDFIETISQESDKLTDLIEHLLDLSRLESGTLRISPEEQPLSAIMDTAMAQLQALTPEHTLHLDIPENLPPVRADPQRVAQVLTNLVNNATKYAPPGTQIAIVAASQGRHVRVSVADAGPGIPPEQRVRVFEPFYQQPEMDGRGDHLKGVGLGLAICRGVIEAQGGRIWVQDHAGPGTTITFTLPIANRH